MKIKSLSPVLGFSLKCLKCLKQAGQWLLDVQEAALRPQQRQQLMFSGGGSGPDLQILLPESSTHSPLPGSRRFSLVPADKRVSADESQFFRGASDLQRNATTDVTLFSVLVRTLFWIIVRAQTPDWSHMITSAPLPLSPSPISCLLASCLFDPSCFSPPLSLSLSPLHFFSIKCPNTSQPITSSFNRDSCDFPRPVLHSGFLFNLIEISVHLWFLSRH